MIICSPQISVSPYASLGGAVHDREILQALANLGNTLLIPLPKGEIAKSNDHILIVPTHHHFFNCYEYNYIFLPAVYQLWKKYHYSWLRIHTPTLIPLGIMIKSLTGVSLHLSIHHQENKTFHKILYQLAAKWFDLFSTVSIYSSEIIKSKLNISDKKIVVVFNGVEEKYSRQQKRQWLIQKLGIDGKFILLYLGSLTERKNLPFLLQVLSNCLHYSTEFRLIICGTGNLESTLRKQVTQLNLSPYVIFTGYIAEENKIDYYNIADIFLYPSLLEGFGLSIAEAMACGVPVIASNTTSIPEVVGDCGLLSNPYDVKDFSQKIQMLANDVNLRKYFSTCGPNRIRSNYSWDKSASLLNQAYHANNYQSP